MTGKDMALPAARATHEPSPDGLGHSVGVANADEIAGWRDGASTLGIKWPLGGYAPGNYCGKCHICNKRIDGVDKRARSCLACAINELREEYEAIDGAFRIKVWNEAKKRGLSDRAAMEDIARQRCALTAKAMEARQGGNGEAGAVHDSAVPQGFAHPTGSIKGGDRG